MNERFKIEDLLKRGYSCDGKGGFIRSKTVVHPSVDEKHKNIQGAAKRKKNPDKQPQDPGSNVHNGSGFPIGHAIALYVKVIMKGNYRRDLDNVLNATADCLVKSGVLLDDRMQIVSEIHMSYENGDSDMTEVWITER